MKRNSIHFRAGDLRPGTGRRRHQPPLQAGGRSVAGQGDLCRRSGGFVVQVCVFGLNGDANRPLVHSNVAGQAIFADRGRYFA